MPPKSTVKSRWESQGVSGPFSSAARKLGAKAETAIREKRETSKEVERRIFGKQTPVRKKNGASKLR
jgi:hypothetical protein